MPRHAVVAPIALSMLMCANDGLSAQSSASAFAPIDIGGVSVSGTLRTRVESWDWFGDSSNSTYTYPGSLLRASLGQVRQTRDWQLELSLPMLFGLPEQPIGAGPAGLGANYFVANDRNTHAAMLFVKQAFVRFKNLGGRTGQSLKVGRMEFFDGAEVSPKNSTLAALKRDRVAARLLANFGFTHAQRSLDGVQYAIDRPTVNVTLLAARPTRGVFQVDGWGELNINVVYGAITGQVGNAADVSEWRLFGLGYIDRRNGVVKTDNRPLIVRPSNRLILRTDAHSLQLADSHDLWYQGGGAFQPTTFGYIGQPASGHQSLAALYDASVDIAVSPRIAVTGYYGYAGGGSVSAANYPMNNHAAFGYVELLLRF